MDEKRNQILAVWKSSTGGGGGGRSTCSFCWQVWYFISVIYNKTKILSAKRVILFWELFFDLIPNMQAKNLLFSKGKCCSYLFCGCISSLQVPQLTWLSSEEGRGTWLYLVHHLASLTSPPLSGPLTDSLFASLIHWQPAVHVLGCHWSHQFVCLFYLCFTICKGRIGKPGELGET